MNWKKSSKKILVCFLFSSLVLVGCQQETPKVLIETPYGNMVVRLFDSTPEHRDNFLKLVNDGYYDGLLFHRVINGFMIQGGDPNSRGAAPTQTLGQGGPGYTQNPEIGGVHIKGSLSAARLPDAQNPQKRSSGSQFFIVGGQRVNPAQINAFAKQKGIVYSAAQIELYGDLGGRPDLDNDYTVFGEVVEGMRIIDLISRVAVGASDRPQVDITMKMSVIQ